MATEDCLKHRFGFACCGPFVATRTAPGEYVIQGENGIQFRVEGAAFAEWVARALTEYDKCLDAIEAHADECFGCAKDREGDEGLTPCANCDALEDRILVRHNAEVEAARLAK